MVGGIRLVLKDHEERPLAVAIDGGLRQKNFVIGSRTPLFDNDKAIAKEGDVVFFPMFSMRDVDEAHPDFRSLLVWNGNDFQTMLRILPPAADTSGSQEHVGPPAGGLLDFTLDLMKPKKGDTLVVDPNDMDKVYAVMAKTTRMTGRIAGWDLIIAPGADVGCMLLLGAILDDMGGWYE